jgi:hypothetical protein
MTKQTNKEPHKYEPDLEYVITAKFKKKGHEVEAFLERLKQAEIIWVEVNKHRYES